MLTLMLLTAALILIGRVVEAIDKADGFDVFKDDKWQ